jgi:hypothetical protein
MNLLHEYLAGKDLGVFPTLALVIFLAASLGVAGYVVFGLRRKEVRDRLASLPLEGDETPNGRRAEEGATR